MRLLFAVLLLIVSAPSVSAEEQIRVGKWILSETVDPIDDSVRSVFILLPDQVIGGRGVKLGIVCADKEFGVSIHWSEDIGWSLLGRKELVVRFDKASAETADWNIRGQQTVVNDADARAFMQKLESAAQLTVRTELPSSGQVTAVFDVFQSDLLTRPRIDKCLNRS